MLVSVVVVLAGCGSSDGDGSRSQSSGPRDTMARWAGARTAGEQCDLLSSGFRFFIGDGEPGRATCVARAPSFFGPPRPASLAIHRISTDHDQTLVDATVGGDRITYYLVEQEGAWRINSIGIREGLGPSVRPGDLD